MTERLRRELDTLPVADVAGPLLAALRTGPAAIVTAAPGAGKSTVLPLAVLDALPPGAGKVVVLEPRRVAARQIAARMAWLLGEGVGDTVGYRVRLESRVGPHTRLEVVTEGVLTRMLLDDAALEDVAVVIFDEFHERNLATDEAFALVRQCQALLRDDLRVVIMSATIDTDALAAALHAPVLASAGRMHPVEVVRTPDEADAANAAQLTARTILEAHRDHEGDILAFLPGEADIRRAATLLADSLGATAIYPLYGLLPADAQARAIAPSRAGERKVVLATPIAETSLTIEGVRVVVDSGLCRKMVFDARSGLSHLQTVRISMDMATQRTGRAGRVAPGVCYRLWSAATEARMAAVRTPEILDADLTPLVLDAAIWGERDVQALPWLTPPPKAAAAHATTTLATLGAIDATGRATPIGRRLAQLPCHPRIARMLTTAATPAAKALAADIAALLEEKDPLAGEADVDLALRLDALRRERRSATPGRWGRIARLAQQYAAMTHATPDDSPANPYEAGALLAAAYPERIGRARQAGIGVFQLSGGGEAVVDGSSPLAAAEWIVAAAMHMKTGGAGRVFLASIVDGADVACLASERDAIFWDSRAGAVVARRETRLGAIVLAFKPLQGDVSQATQRAVSDAIARNGAAMLAISDEVQHMQRRIAFVAARHPELELPRVETDAICAAAHEWVPLFAAKATTVAALRRIDMCDVVWSRLTYEQQQAVDRCAPTHVTVPTGSRIRLDYRTGAEAPVLRVRLQECFGMVATPLADGAPVLMELLSPGFKPVQLTTDLPSFWHTTYFEVRKDLRRRYPKHHWPDNPLEAEPVRGVPRR